MTEFLGRGVGGGNGFQVSRSRVVLAGSRLLRNLVYSSLYCIPTSIAFTFEHVSSFSVLENFPRFNVF